MLPLQFKLFAITSVAIWLHISWLPFAVLLSWVLYQHVFPLLVPELRQASYRIMAIAGLAGFFLSVLFRELARVLTAHYLEIPVESVTLHVLGGIAEIPETRTEPKTILAIAAIGFLASLVLGAVIAWLLIKMVDARTPLEITGVGFFLVLANWTLAVANMAASRLLAGWHHLSG